MLVGTHVSLREAGETLGSVAVSNIRALYGRPADRAIRSQSAVRSAKEMHVQVTPLHRPLPPGEGRGEGLPATSDSSISSHPSDGEVHPVRMTLTLASREPAYR